MSLATRTLKKITPPGLKAQLYKLRSILEFCDYTVREPELLATCPPGDGHPVLVIPGFLTNDLATMILRRFLIKLGYRAYGWRLGFNLGPKPGQRLKLQNRIAVLKKRHRQRVSLVGWSLGGLYVRELARWKPGDVRRVITLGSPLRGGAAAAGVWQMFRTLNNRYLRSISSGTMAEFAKPLCVPTVSIYTRSDGVVAWEACAIQRGCAGRNIEVSGSHTGMVYNPEALKVVAEALRGNI